MGENLSRNHPKGGQRGISNVVNVQFLTGEEKRELALESTKQDTVAHVNSYVLINTFCLYYYS